MLVMHERGAGALARALAEAPQGSEVRVGLETSTPEMTITSLADRSSFPVIPDEGVDAGQWEIVCPR